MNAPKVKRDGQNKEESFKIRITPRDDQIQTVNDKRVNSIMNILAKCLRTECNITEVTLN